MNVAELIKPDLSAESRPEAETSAIVGLLFVTSSEPAVIAAGKRLEGEGVRVLVLGMDGASRPAELSAAEFVPPGDRRVTELRKAFGVMLLRTHLVIVDARGGLLCPDALRPLLDGRFDGAGARPGAWARGAVRVPPSPRGQAGILLAPYSRGPLGHCLPGDMLVARGDFATGRRALLSVQTTLPMFDSDSDSDGDSDSDSDGGGSDGGGSDGGECDGGECDGPSARRATQALRRALRLAARSAAAALAPGAAVAPWGISGVTGLGPGSSLSLREAAEVETSVVVLARLLRSVGRAGVRNASAPTGELGMRLLAAYFGLPTADQLARTVAQLTAAGLSAERAREAALGGCRHRAVYVGQRILLAGGGLDVAPLLDADGAALTALGPDADACLPAAEVEVVRLTAVEGGRDLDIGVVGPQSELKCEDAVARGQ